METSTLPPPQNPALPDRIRMQEGLAVFVALIAGFTDSVGLLRWKTFVSFMSGNTTSLGAAISENQSGIIETTATVIICFLLGIFAGTCLSLRTKEQWKTLSFYLVSGILVLFTAISYRYNIKPVPSIAIVGFSMGMMNTIVTSVGNLKVNTDFVTGTLNSLAVNTAMLTMSNDAVAKKEYRSNAIHLLLLWIGFLAGAWFAPLVWPYVGSLILLIPAIMLLVCAVMISTSIIKL